MKRSPLKRRKPLKRSGGLRGTSKRKCCEYHTWKAQEKAFINLNPLCKPCEDMMLGSSFKGHGAVEVHHTKGRRRFLLDVSTYLPVCRHCHTVIHNNPEWARAKGYMLDRIGKADGKPDGELIPSLEEARKFMATLRKKFLS